jgi:hypothetical protein
MVRACKSVLVVRKGSGLKRSLNGRDENVSTHAYRVDDGDDDSLD